jgi:uncharacterized membrane protein
MNIVLDWSAKVAPCFIAVPMAIFGVQHFIYLTFVAEFIPAWIPWRTFWACFTGIALIAAAVGIVSKKWDQWAASLLGAMILLWVVLLHIPRVAAESDDPQEWRGAFQALAMSSFSFVLASTLARNHNAEELKRGRLDAVMMRLAESGGRFAPPFVALSMMALGVQHFVFPEVTVPQVPLWIPGTRIGNYLCGAALFAAGAGITTQRTARPAAAFLGMAIFLSMIFIHLPVVVTSPRFESDWCKTLVMSGGAFLLTKTLPRKRIPAAAERLPAIELRPRSSNQACESEPVHYSSAQIHIHSCPRELRRPAESADEFGRS